MEPSTLMIVALLLGVISIVLILCVVHISGKVDELCKTQNEMLEIMKQKTKN